MNRQLLWIDGWKCGPFIKAEGRQSFLRPNDGWDKEEGGYAPSSLVINNRRWAEEFLSPVWAAGVLRTRKRGRLPWLISGEGCRVWLNKVNIRENGCDHSLCTTKIRRQENTHVFSSGQNIPLPWEKMWRITKFNNKVIFDRKCKYAFTAYLKFKSA